MKSSERGGVFRAINVQWALLSRVQIQLQSAERTGWSTVHLGRLDAGWSPGRYQQWRQTAVAHFRGVEVVSATRSGKQGRKAVLGGDSHVTFDGCGRGAAASV